MFPAQSQQEGSRRSELVEKYKQALQKAQNDEKEVALLLRQTEGEVERNTARRDQAAQRIREMETNLDQYARQEIGPIYAAAHAAELRVYVMKAQAEQLQARRESLSRSAMAIQELLPYVERAGDSAPVVSRPVVTAPPTKTATMNIIQAQEDERQRLSRQMHDGPAQALTNLILQAEICERFMATDHVRGKAELANLRNMVNATFRGVREFIFDLRPMILDDLGLVPTLRKYVQAFQDKTRITTTLTVTGRERRLPQVVEVALFRAIQESLNNVAEHARASQVQVSLDLKDENVARAVVEDNGAGFNAVSALQGARERRTLGIAGILDRVESLGGSLTLDSAPGRGAKVQVDVPLV